MIQLISDKRNCCGCGICKELCPKNAIEMKADKQGFIYPEIDANKCISCGKCIKNCHLQGNLDDYGCEKQVYAVATKNTDIHQSTSGGAFASMAKTILSNGGYVVGASLCVSENIVEIKHIIIDDVKDLVKILGSKYVQSNAVVTFSGIQKLLSEQKEVLFSGTPCQVSALKHYLGKDYDNLITVDIICHGVPSAAIFQDYCRFVEKTCSIKIKTIVFRDKTNGWGLSGSIIGTRKGKNVKLLMRQDMSSYYNFFLNSEFYRESCYSCKFASGNRPSEITIGDYWGIENTQPELLVKNGGNFDPQKGISCLIVNNEKGKSFFLKIKGGMEIAQSTYEMISRNNHQLHTPSVCSGDRAAILKAYERKGYIGVEKYFIRKQGLKYFARLVKYRKKLSSIISDEK